MGKQNAVQTTPVIYRLHIGRFRGLSTFTWRPARGVNVILGGGDVCKTTILEAIGLLLSPANPTTVPDTDYHARGVPEGFVIEAIISLPPETGINHQSKHAWMWDWNGKDAEVPSLDAEGGDPQEPVYKIRVRGSEDLDLFYEIVQPDGTVNGLPPSLRRAIGLVRLGGDDRNDRDLRLVQGSALDRLLSDKGLRSRLASELTKSDVKEELSEEAKQALVKLDKAFAENSLPSGLDLSITGSQGYSIAALIGLTARRGEAQLPLASWGSGTRRLAALAIAEQRQGDCPITLIDEIERGLEPYRQRSLMAKLQDGKSQVFLTTHSPFAISAASRAAIWYVDVAGKIGPLNATQTEQHRATDPETFLSRLAVIGEGATETGFVSVLLERALPQSPQQLGVHCSDGGGHERALGLMEALVEGGLRFAVFADRERRHAGDKEGKHPARWKKISDKVGGLLFRWSHGCLDENIVLATPEDKLEDLLRHPTDEDKTKYRFAALADRLGIQEKDFASIKAKAGEGLRQLIIEAALGTVPEGKKVEENKYKAHAKTFFKSVAGGRELGEKLFISLGLWPELKGQLLPFCNAVRTEVGLTELKDLPV